MELLKKYKQVRARTEAICRGLQAEDFVVQPVVDVSPPKWHLGHTTWFFETFLLQPNAPAYELFNSQYNYVFNSYYESVGARVVRTDRGNLSRPSVADIMAYRAYVDEAMHGWLSVAGMLTNDLQATLELGLNHEEQHQELLITDIKYILGHNPLLPAYSTDYLKPDVPTIGEEQWISVPEGVYEMGAKGDSFCFDNELNRHKVYVAAYQIQQQLVSNAAYLQFIQAGGYTDFRFWHAEGWEWVKANQIIAPLYWHQLEGNWYHYTPEGLVPLPLQQPVCHISYYEAWAYAQWRGLRLPTEAEWEIAQDQMQWGSRWEWTESAYLPYPGFTKAEGAIGEYNGKFMVNQMVLRGASEATSPGHSRPTYRNFFQTPLRWQFTGLRLAQNL
ncbi:ergothioneine biosynthesis protein EgtB [Adhaeribacter aerolatus]|uniref:Ergothioneine biosynthesis protein EgtB n=1 Tax=Adhaeribacter aerolatus TaxID=670289 RepID=A0A512AVP1_9BACT|nr:ergothioneine biosynthesis protein EgtB [Adhaeribacter aerolatus]GEO03740.1 ergothioneine biosynthesis protein EgtB [Adhaeribacter aerolatus]